MSFPWCLNDERLAVRLMASTWSKFIGSHEAKIPLHRLPRSSLLLRKGILRRGLSVLIHGRVRLLVTALSPEEPFNIRFIDSRTQITLPVSNPCVPSSDTLYQMWWRPLTRSTMLSRTYLLVCCINHNPSQDSMKSLTEDVKLYDKVSTIWNYNPCTLYCILSTF